MSMFFSLLISASFLVSTSPSTGTHGMEAPVAYRQNLAAMPTMADLAATIHEYLASVGSAPKTTSSKPASTGPVS